MVSLIVGLIPVVGSLKYADEVGTLVNQGLKGADEAGEVAKTAAKKADKQVYELPAGYKPSLNFTDDEAKEFVARGWLPKSAKPSPIATDDEIKRMLELEKQEGLSNAVEEVGETKIAGKSGTGDRGVR